MNNHYNTMQRSEERRVGKECSASRHDNGHSGVLPMAAEFLSRRLDGVGPTSSLKRPQDLAECPR